MGAGASARPADPDLLFDELPTYTIAQLQHAAVGERVLVVGHVEALTTFETPFAKQSCVAADVVGGMACWKPQKILDLPHWDGSPSYHKFSTVFRASRGESFVLRDPPKNYLVESPGELHYVATEEGASVRVVWPGHSEWARGAHLCSTWLGHRHCELDLRFDAEHGILIGSQWALDVTGAGRPAATLLSPGRVVPNAQAFWNAHISTPGARCGPRWNAMVNQGGAGPCWMRRHKVSERTLRVGDACCVIGELRRSESGALELHCGEQGLLVSNIRGVARKLPPLTQLCPHQGSITQGNG